MRKSHIGSNFDDFLREEGMFEAVEAAAIKRVIAFQIQREMKREALTKSDLARRMKTSRAAVDRLLDPAAPSVTLQTLSRVAKVLGKTLKVELR
jgi:DNA-binding Xre family transcriptional regulator